MRPFLVHVPKTGGSLLKQGFKKLPDIDLNTDVRNQGHAYFNSNIRDEMKKAEANYVVYSNDHKVFPMHYEPIDRERELPKSERFTIAVLREPLDILASHFFDGANGWSDVRKRHNLKDFDSFVKIFCDEDIPPEEFWLPPLKRDLYFQTKNENQESVVDYWLVKPREQDLRNGVPSLNIQMYELLRRQGYDEETLNQIPEFTQPNHKSVHYSVRRPRVDPKDYLSSRTKQLLALNQNITYWSYQFHRYAKKTENQ